MLRAPLKIHTSARAADLARFCVSRRRRAGSEHICTALQQVSALRRGCRGNEWTSLGFGELTQLPRPAPPSLGGLFLRFLGFLVSLVVECPFNTLKVKLLAGDQKMDSPVL